MLRQLSSKPKHNKECPKHLCFNIPRHADILRECKFFDKVCFTSLKLTDKRVMVRVDFDVDIYKERVVDFEKILLPLPTIHHLEQCGCKLIVLISHLGNPGGKRVEHLSLQPVAKELDRQLFQYCGLHVLFFKNLYDPEVHKICANPPKCTVILLENMRFYPEEEGCTKNKKMRITSDMLTKFRLYLKSLADIYINESFCQMHLAHSSMIGHFFSMRVAGLRLQQELYAFTYLIRKPQRPFYVIFAGKNSDLKLQMMKNFLDIVDGLIIAGGLAFTFLKLTRHIQIGNSPETKNCRHVVRDILRDAERLNVELYVPTDLVVGNLDDSKSNLKLVNVEKGIPSGKCGLDIGDITQQCFSFLIEKARTILLYGPLGVIERSNFQDGTISVMECLSSVTTNRLARTILIGKSTIEFAQNLGLADSFSHCSEGQATREIMLGRNLPSVEALLTDTRCVKPNKYHNKWRFVQLKKLKKNKMEKFDNDSDKSITLKRHNSEVTVLSSSLSNIDLE